MKCTVIFYGNLLRHISGVRVKRFSGIEEWLDLVKNAELVITNSYHGLSFAINFHKKFSVYWLTNSPQSNTRIKNLLSQIDVQDYEEGMICNPKWEKVEQNLDKLLSVRTYYKNAGFVDLMQLKRDRTDVRSLLILILLSISPEE